LKLCLFFPMPVTHPGLTLDFTTVFERPGSFPSYQTGWMLSMKTGATASFVHLALRRTRRARVNSSRKFLTGHFDLDFLDTKAQDGTITGESRVTEHVLSSIPPLGIYRCLSREQINFIMRQMGSRHFRSYLERRCTRMILLQARSVNGCLLHSHLFLQQILAFLSETLLTACRPHRVHASLACWIIQQRVVLIRNKYFAYFCAGILSAAYPSWRSFVTAHI
jgi:hypothetical protein